MRSRNIALAATALSVAWCGTGWADETREKALEQKLAEMQKQIDEMAKRIGDGSNRSDDNLEARMAGMEKILGPDQGGLFGRWDKGSKFKTTDGEFAVQIFGRFQLDFTWWGEADDLEAELGEVNSSTEFRRVRLGAGGTMYKNIVYKVEGDFADSGTGAWNFADVFMEIKQPFAAPLNLRIGHFDEPFSLDRLTSSRNLTFTERNLTEAFAPARNTGIMLTGQQLDNRLSWFAGAFRDSNAFGNTINPPNEGEHALTARVAGRPHVNEDGTEFVHLGLSYSHRRPMNDAVQFRTRPEVHVGPRFVDTGTISDICGVSLLGLEAAGVMGPFAAHGELVSACLDGRRGQDDYSFCAKSIEASYFITGENREYDAAGARFDRIKVKKNFGTDGMGAFQVALRWSDIDLNDGSIRGGDMTDWTLGLNWYLNPNTRVIFNVIRSNPSRSGINLERITAFVVRFAYDF